jgi:DNA replication and repair protein RecF
MPLANLQLERFRCITATRLDFDSRYNLIVGANASGKTSLLEAIYFLGRGRSFRTRRLERIIQQGAGDFLAVGSVVNPPVTTVLGLRGTRGATEIRVGGSAAGSAAELAVHFPPQVIDPDVHKLLEEGPTRRRRFLDWGVFHVEPFFMDAWQRYHRALRQRTAALRVGSTSGAATLAAWDAELATSGEVLAERRSAYLALLAPFLATIGQRLLQSDVELVYHRGWAGGIPYAQALQEGLERDQRYGLTHSGPHRADLGIRVGGVPAKERVSRGQQKLLAAGLILAQVALQEAYTPGRTALLLDDPAAELDPDNLERLVAVVRTLPIQLFVTSLRQDLPGFGTPGAMFHVEHGNVHSR